MSAIHERDTYKPIASLGGMKEIGLIMAGSRTITEVFRDGYLAR